MATPDWLQNALDSIEATTGVESVKHDSKNDYQVFVTDNVQKDTVQNIVEGLHSSEYTVRVSPTDNEDWFFASIEQQ